ncbi:hypothetical protein [Glutamicibacter protophormiae]|uniref:hypothetical protein n=1 Tax=Glutamicibacter protophormiae TaxID=37930 RepID=UPI0033267078
MNGWNNAAHPDPTAMHPEVHDAGVNPGAVAWFESTGVHRRERIPFYLQMLDRYDGECERVTTALVQPGPLFKAIIVTVFLSLTAVLPVVLFPRLFGGSMFDFRYVIPEMFTRHALEFVELSLFFFRRWSRPPASKPDNFRGIDRDNYDCDQCGGINGTSYRESGYERNQS